MITKYSIEEIEEMRECVIKYRNKCLGPETEFDVEGAINLSHVTALLYEVLQDQKREKIASET